MPIGFQLYSARHHGPLESTLATLAELGYRHVEAYSDLIAAAGDLRAALDRHGLSMPSTHFALDDIEASPAKALDVAEVLGVSSLFSPYLVASERPSDAAGWRRFGERLTRVAESLEGSGIRYGWHNHDFEFKALPDGSLPIEHLFAGAPAIAWEADIAWIERAGVDPKPWLQRFGDRITTVHVKDIALAGHCEDEDGWADPGSGTMDWPALFRTLDTTTAGLDELLLVAEHDKPSDNTRFARHAMELFQREKLHKAGGSECGP